jgi:hypothetical protein
LRFALTGTNPDPKKAAEDDAKTIGGRLASLFVGAFLRVCGSVRCSDGFPRSHRLAAFFEIGQSD